jgi:hypothetical protein
MAKTSPGPANAMSTPDSAGPITNAAPREMAIRALASWSRLALTVCGMSPVEAGTKNAAAVPWRAATTMMCQTSAVPVKSR